jgi:hypothetical protein
MVPTSTNRKWIASNLDNKSLIYKKIDCAIDLIIEGSVWRINC